MRDKYKPFYSKQNRVGGGGSAIYLSIYVSIYLSIY